MAHPLNNSAAATLDSDRATMSTEQLAPVDMPAGGPDPQRFDWAEAWHPLSLVKDLDPQRPTAFTLLGQDLVIWWEPSAQTWRVMADQCPHRLARLSEGRVSEAGYLECPYHGWAFSGTGQCEQIPQSSSDVALNSPRACVQSFPTVVRQGLLFIYPGKAENAAKIAIPVVEALEEDPEDWVCVDIVRDLPYDALTLLENVLDVSHVSYTHHRTVGDRANAAPVDLELIESGKQGFRGIWQEGPRRGALGQQNTQFTAPNFMCHDLTSDKFGRTLTVVYAVPIRKGQCRLIARLPFKFNSPWPGRVMRLTPTWYSHISQNAILEDDQIFLHFQERALEESGGSRRLSKAFYLPTKADLFISELHQWLLQYQAQPFPDHLLPPAVSKPQLLERYHSHVSNCSSCRGALKNIQRLQLGLGIGATLFWTALVLISLLGFNIPTISAVFLSVLALALLAGKFGLNRLEQRFYQGREIPPRNLPDRTKQSKLKAQPAKKH